MKKKRYLLYLSLVIIVIGILYLISNFSFIGTKIIDKTGDGDIIDSIYTLKINLNGASSVNKNNIKCIKKGDGCYVTLPRAFRNNGRVLGYSLIKDSHDASFLDGEDINLINDTTLYVISTVTYNVNIDIGSSEYLEYKPYCSIYNTEKGCYVTLPIFNKKGNELRGYSLFRDSLTGSIYPNMKYYIKGDVNLYAVYNNITRGVNLDITKSYIYNNTIIEKTSDCPNDIENKYKTYLDRINTYAPYLLIKNKIYLLGDKTFDKIWGDNYYGMNYGAVGSRMVDMRCSNKYDYNYYISLVHEMAHTIDFYYGNYFNDELSNNSDIMNLFTKYKNSGLFRTYSFSNVKEFFADSYKYYYFKYLDPIEEYSNLTYPSDLKFTIEKYINCFNYNYEGDLCK